MRTDKFETEAEWLEGRKGRITGTRLKDLVGRTAKPKKGYYEMIAERVALPPNEENVMDRGHRLESDALDRLEEETGLKFCRDLVIWSRDEDRNIAISPDGYVEANKIEIGAEVKCLNSASHIEAWLTKEIPIDYKYQVIQYFVVNDSLNKLYFVFHDPRMPRDYFHIEVNRADVQDQVDEYLALEREVLETVALIERKLTF